MWYIYHVQCSADLANIRDLYMYSAAEQESKTVTLFHRRRNQGGKGGWSPPKVLVYYCIILCYNLLLHGWCPPIETDLPTLLCFLTFEQYEPSNQIIYHFLSKYNDVGTKEILPKFLHSIATQ